MLKAAIVGGSGYAAGELIRLLLNHPEIRLGSVMSRSSAGRPVWTAHPKLRGFCDLTFAEFDPEAAAREHDVVFLCLEHAAAHALAPTLTAQARVVDLSADFRFDDAATFAEHYEPHANPEWLAKSVYGLTEYVREKLPQSALTAGPGCFATGALLGLMPLAESGDLGDFVCIDGKTGSSGSGARPSATTHHPERAADFRAYSLLGHRHVPEIRQEIGRFGARPQLMFAAHSAPLVRGLFSTIYVKLKRPMSTSEVRAVYEARYGAEAFVRVVERPRVSAVAGTNFCEIGVGADGAGGAIILSAIDNLGKGAAGQAVQNCNAMFGLNERAGLLQPAAYP